VILELCPQSDLMIVDNNESFKKDHAAEEVSAPFWSKRVGDSYRAENRNGEVLINLADAWILAEDGVVLMELSVSGLAGHVSRLPPVNDEKTDSPAEHGLINGLPFVGMGGRADNKKNKNCGSHGWRV
jgi:hypothetical protein